MESRLKLSKKGMEAYTRAVAILKISKKPNGKNRRELRTANRALRLEIHKAVIKDLSRRNAKSVLEIGCGDGKLLVKLASIDNFRSSHLFGIDRSRKGIRIARKRSKRVRFAVGRSNRIPYKIKFDIIFTVLSFHEWENGYESIPGILARLSPGGSFIIYDTMPMSTRSLLVYKKRGVKLTVLKDRILVKIVFSKPSSTAQYI